MSTNFYSNTLSSKKYLSLIKKKKIEKKKFIFQNQAMLMEASTGNWAAQAHRPMFQPLTPEALQSEDPMARLATWTPIPVLAQHSRLDEWIRFEGQCAFLEALREHNAGHPVDLQAYDRTGAPKEHIGFGKYGGQAKDLCRDFLLRIFGANSRK